MRTAQVLKSRDDLSIDDIGAQTLASAVQFAKLAISKKKSVKLLPKEAACRDRATD